MSEIRDSEKVVVAEDSDGSNYQDPIRDPDEGKSAEERAELERQLVRKLDLRLIPWLCVLYLASFLDRTNIGNAKIVGLQTDLNHMSSGKYNAALSIFFVSYSLFEPVSNVLLKKLRPKVWFTTIMILWGLSMTFMGFVKNWSGLMAARWWLGLWEAGLYPGVNYYLSCWYKRSEFGVRAAIFFSAAAVSGSFGGLLAAAIENMDGIGGLHGWAWIFILEGIATTLIGIASYFILVDFPDEAHFLTDDERLRVIRRLRADNQASANHESFSFKYVKQSLSDWKTYMGMIMFAGAAGALYAFSLFLPTIISNLGYKATKAQLLTVPVYAVAGVFTISTGFLADRYQRRGIFNIGCGVIAVAGYAILLGSKNYKLSYAGTYLAAMGVYPCISNTITWVSNNAEGVYKRGFVLGLVIGFGNLNGVMSSNVYQGRDSPWYRPGHLIVLIYLAGCLVAGSIVYHVLLRRENSRRLRGERDTWISGLDEKEIADLGDQRPDFIYTL
ncbi:hypothetical protein TWF696_007724 [Orbilia brochopaga]|uniref:Major facilitator superfamily (MFS) profile domain-containing protein n=1 Tax=Orbilia brochopaga TaxID=3140254 RepID=A0AAV9UPE6_9PEZI